MWIFQSDGNDLELNLEINSHMGYVTEVARDFRTCGLISLPHTAFCKSNFAIISNKSLDPILIEESSKNGGRNSSIGGNLKVLFVKVELKYWLKIVVLSMIRDRLRLMNDKFRRFIFLGKMVEIV